MEEEVISDSSKLDQIDQEVAVTRESLTEKIAALETQLVGSVQTAADTLTDTVDAVKSIVTETPGAVTDSVRQAATAFGETVKDTFDVSGHVREHPWVAFGGSFCLGWLIGTLTSRESPRPSSGTANTPVAASPQTSIPEPQPGVAGEVLKLVGDKARELARTAVESGFAALTELVRTEAPRLLAGALPESVLNPGHRNNGMNGTKSTQSV